MANEPTNNQNNETNWDLLNEINEMFNDIEGSQYDTPEEKKAREQRVAATKAERQDATESEEMVEVFGPYDISDDEDDEEIVIGFHHIPAPKIELANDDLPFSDVGVDDEDTKELPAITMQHTPCNPTRPTIGDAIKLPLDKLIDMALDPNDTEAYETLKAYDWTASLWCISIESNDLSQLAWNMWYELTKLRRIDPRYDDETRKVNRAFELLDILRNAVKAV